MLLDHLAAPLHALPDDRQAAAIDMLNESEAGEPAPKKSIHAADITQLQLFA